jgi:hypothetical protein
MEKPSTIRGEPQADAGHGGEDLGQRVGGKEVLELGAQGVTLFQHGQQLAGQPADDTAVLVGGEDRDGLFAEVARISAQGVSHPW